MKSKQKLINWLLSEGKKWLLLTWLVFIAIMLINTYKMQLLADLIDVQPVQAQVNRPVEVELSIQEQVINLLKENGLTWPEIAKALAIIDCESTWNPYAINKNKDGSFDLGLWQINEKYQKINRDCAFDVNCATLKAIEIYRARENWSAWVCS